MSETAQAFAWIVATAQADSALMAAAPGGVWETFADIGTATPYVQIVQQSSSDVNTMNAVRLFTDKLLQIKAIGPSSGYSALVTVADRIDTLFKSVRNVALSSGGILACYREQEIAYDELVNGASVSHLGGLYRIELQGT